NFVDRAISAFSKRCPLVPGVIPWLIEDVDTQDVIYTERLFEACNGTQVIQPDLLVVWVVNLATATTGIFFTGEVVAFAGCVSIGWVRIQTTCTPTDVVGARVDVNDHLKIVLIS